MLLCTIIIDFDKKVNEGLRKSRCFLQEKHLLLPIFSISCGCPQYRRHRRTFFSARRRQRLTLLRWMPRSAAICGIVLSWK